MRQALLPISFLLAAGCSSAHRMPLAETALARPMHVIPMQFDSIDDAENPYIAKSTDSRKVGDFATTEFAKNGKPAIIMQQRVLARDGATSVLEISIKDGARTQIFRLRTETATAGEQVLDVTRVDNGMEHASTIASYEAAMQKTVPSVERNDGIIDSEPVTIEVGGRKLEAVRTTYKVSYAGKPATMSVIQRDGFAWGDLGGDIVGTDGKTLFSTRVVEAGSDSTKAVADRK